MPINIEDTLIRVLVDTQKGVQDVKKLNNEIKNTGKQATISGKDLLKMAGAFGGVSAAVDLAVKAIATYVQYIKNSETAYIDAAKAASDYTTDAIKALDDLEVAKAEAARIDGERHTERMQQWREWRLAQITDRNLVKQSTELMDRLWTEYFVSMQRGLVPVMTQADWIRDYLADMNQLAEEGKDGWLSYAEGLDAANARAVDVTETTKKLVAENEDLAEIEKQRQYEAMMSTQRAIDIEAEAAAERLRIQFQYDQSLRAIREEQHQEELDRIESEKEANKEAAFTVLNSMSNLYSAIGTLVNNRYQAEAEAAEQGSEKHKQILKKQFQAEKAMSVVQSVIATSLGIAQAIPNIPLMIFAGLQGAIQTAAILATKPPAFALGTSPSGYTVPPGYEGDNFPVMAKSGETVNISRPGENQNQTLHATFNIDGYQFGQVITRLTNSGKATINSRAVVA